MLRRIESEEEREKREKRRTKILVVLMLFLLLGSTAGYAFFSGDSSSSTNDPNNGVQNLGGQWAVKFGDQTLYFLTSPEESKNVSINMTYEIRDYYQQPVYVSSNSTEIANEIMSNVGPYTERIQQACYGNCTTDFPEKNCNENLIVWTPSDTNRVYQKDKCVFIDGDIKAVDAFLYRIFGII